MEQIGNAGAGFRSITENIDTTTPTGRMMMQMVGAFAEFERAMIRERTSAGLAAARAEGRIGGRRKKLDAVKRNEIAESVITGRKSGADMARLYNISQPTVSRIVTQHRTTLSLCRSPTDLAADDTTVELPPPTTPLTTLVDQVYRTTLCRPPDTEELRHHIDLL